MKHIDIYDDLKELRSALNNSKIGLSPSGRGFALSFTDRILIDHLIEQIDIELDIANRRCKYCDKFVKWAPIYRGSHGRWIHITSNLDWCNPDTTVADPYPLEEN